MHERETRLAPRRRHAPHHGAGLELDLAETCDLHAHA
jgi:hypothetical protein